VYCVLYCDRLIKIVDQAWVVSGVKCGGRMV
jgi:hypothetical protein